MSVLYSTNFDSFTVGTLPPNWLDLDSAGWQVINFRPISGSKAFGMGVLTDNHIALYTGISAMRDFDIQYTWKVLNTTGSGAIEENMSIVLRSAIDGSSYYMFNPQWVSGTNSQSQIYLFKWDGTGFTIVDSGTFGAFTAGDIVKVRAQTQGSTFRFKAWLASSSEPDTWITFSDSQFSGNGYGGLRSGSGTSGSNSDPVISIDDFSISDFTIPTQTQVALNDPNLFVSPYNWLYIGATELRTNCSGAYFKLGFTGTSIEINFNAAVSNTSIKYSIDNATYVSYDVPSTNGQINVTGLESGSHQIVVYATMLWQGADKWVTPVSVLSLSSIFIDNGATSIAPSLKPNRILFYGDSITEAVAGTGNDSTKGWASLIGQALSSEYGIRGFGGVGFIENNGTPDQVASVVPFYTPGDNTNSNWNKIDASHSLLVSGLYSPLPDDIFIAYGTNDALAGASDSSVQGSVAGVLSAIRAAATNKRILLIVPFGGFKQTAITAGFNQYQGISPDSKTFLIYTGTDSNLSGAISFETTDGYHPDSVTHGIKAVQIADARKSKLSTGGGINGSGILGFTQTSF